MRRVARLSYISVMMIAATLAAAGVVGGALWQMRGPDRQFIPETTAVSLPDGRAIFVQVHEVTLTEWTRCVEAGACTLALRSPVGRAQADYPATGLSWLDANEYLTWINHVSRHSFRLPTKQEWEFMASKVLPAKPDPIFTDPNLTWASAYLTEGLGGRRLEPSGSYAVSPDGVADLDGNVWEWTQTCYDGSVSAERCPAYYAMGEHEAVMSFLIRDAARGGCAVGAPPAHLGMRLVSDTALLAD